MVRRNARGGNWLHVCGDIAAKVRSKSLLKLRAEGSQSPGIGGVMGNARSRRVRFQQDNKKSQSLETPYHHSHQQQKLGVEMEGSDMHERAASFTSIHQYANAKGTAVLHLTSLVKSTASNLIDVCLAIITSNAK